MIENESYVDVLDKDEPKYAFATEEKQEARAFLRERFLRIVTGVVGKKAEFHLYENTNLNAEFRGVDVDCLELYVRNLKTPIGVIPEATLRTSDIIHFSVKDLHLPESS